MSLLQKLVCVLSIFILIGFAPIFSQVLTPQAQRNMEESNRIYSGNKYNIPPDQYEVLKKYRKQFYNTYYHSYPYYNYYYGSPFDSYPYYNYYGPDYGYYYYGGIPPPPVYNQAFPDSDRADALYRYLQSR